MRIPLIQVAVLVTASALAASDSAFAARRERGLETYAAVEPEIGVDTEAAVPQPASRKAQNRPTATPTFDPVPAGQVDSIVRRVQLVERLVREHARAYDYRALTVPELENIVARLDLEKTQARAPEEP